MKLRDGLRKASQPLLLVFDTFDKATEEARDFVAKNILAIAERLAASDPANAGWQRDLWVSYWLMADLAEQRGETAEAKGWWRKAHDTLAAMKQRGLHVSPEDEGFLAWL